MEKRRNILQAVVLPDGDDRKDWEGLFFGVRGNGGDASLEVRFYSYYNLFSLSKWKKYASIRDVGLHLEGDGPATLRVFLRASPDSVEIILEKPISLDGGYDSPPIPVDGLEGLLYFSLEVPRQSAGGCLKSGHFWTTDEPRREVRLRIVVTTYKREEYVRACMNMFRAGGFAAMYGAPSSARLYVVDNGNTLSAGEGGGGVTIIRNPNTGGAGGFSRGMLEALDEAEATHILLMDDDISVKAESIIRAANLLRFAESPALCVGGDMLNDRAPGELFEQGASIAGHRVHYHKRRLDLLAEGNLWRACEEERIDYNAWWFFMFPMKVCEEIGLALPIFFCGDDVDFSLRAVGRGYGPIVCLNGACVRHGPFVFKENAANIYYVTRNITLGIFPRHAYASTGACPVWPVLAELSWRYAKALYLHNYDVAEAMLAGFDDFCKGPEFLLALDAEAHHRKVLAAVESRTEPFPPEMFDAEKYERDVSWRGGILARAAGKATLNSLLIPRFLRRPHREGRVDAGTAYQTLPAMGGVNTAGAFRAHELLYLDRGAMMGFRCAIQPWRGIKLWIRGLLAACLLFFRLKPLAKRYADRLPELTDAGTWRRLLKLSRTERGAQ